MNERIGKLAVEAGAHWEHGDWNMPSAVYFSERDLEKFAQLIVKECVDVIRKEVSLKYKDGGETEEFMGGHYASSMLARVKIKNHFGVKE